MIKYYIFVYSDYFGAKAYASTEDLVHTIAKWDKFENSSPAVWKIEICDRDYNVVYDRVYKEVYDDCKK